MASSPASSSLPDGIYHHPGIKRPYRARHANGSLVLDKKFSTEADAVAAMQKHILDNGLPPPQKKRPYTYKQKKRKSIVPAAGALTANETPDAVSFHTLGYGVLLASELTCEYGLPLTPPAVTDKDFSRIFNDGIDGTDTNRWQATVEFRSLEAMYIGRVTTIAREKFSLAPPNRHLVACAPAHLGRSKLCETQSLHRDAPQGFFLVIAITPNYTIAVVTGSHRDCNGDPYDLDVDSRNADILVDPIIDVITLENRGDSILCYGVLVHAGGAATTTGGKSTKKKKKRNPAARENMLTEGYHVYLNEPNHKMYKEGIEKLTFPTCIRITKNGRWDEGEAATRFTGPTSQKAMPMTVPLHASPTITLPSGPPPCAPCGSILSHMPSLTSLCAQTIPLIPSSRAVL